MKKTRRKPYRTERWNTVKSMGWSSKPWQLCHCWHSTNLAPTAGLLRSASPGPVALGTFPLPKWCTCSACIGDLVRHGENRKENDSGVPVAEAHRCFFLSLAFDFDTHEFCVPKYMCVAFPISHSELRSFCACPTFIYSGCSKNRTSKNTQNLQKIILSKNIPPK